MNEAMQARVDKIQRELARREALSTSQRQARYITGRGRSGDVAEDRADEREAAWGDHLIERPELEGDVSSRRQAARLTRGASSRGGA